jgi:hypothetical protein
VGLLGGPGGAAGGALIGGMLGTADGVLEQYSKNRSDEQKREDARTQELILNGAAGISEPKQPAAIVADHGAIQRRRQISGRSDLLGVGFAVRLPAAGSLR